MFEKMRALVMLLVLVLVAVILFIFVIGDAPPRKAELVINGQPILSDKTRIVAGNGEIPVVETLAWLGVSVKWDSDVNATLVHGEKTLKLSLVDKTLIDLETGSNLLLMVPGGDYYCCDTVEQDVVVSEDTLHHILWVLGWRNYFSIDNKQGTIYLTVEGHGNGTIVP